MGIISMENPDLGPSSNIQLLDEKGKEEEGDFQRNLAASKVSMLHKFFRNN